MYIYIYIYIYVYICICIYVYLRLRIHLHMPRRWRTTVPGTNVSTLPHLLAQLQSATARSATARTTARTTTARTTYKIIKHMPSILSMINNAHRTLRNKKAVNLLAITGNMKEIMIANVCRQRPCRSADPPAWAPPAESWGRPLVVDESGQGNPQMGASSNSKHIFPDDPRHQM